MATVAAFVLDEDMDTRKQTITLNNSQTAIKRPSPGGGEVNDPAERYCGADEVQQTRLRPAVFGT